MTPTTTPNHVVRFAYARSVSEYGPEIDPDDPKSIKNLLDRLDIEHFLNVQRYGAGNP